MSASIPRFICHACQGIGSSAPLNTEGDPSCARCESTFIEEIEGEPAPEAGAVPPTLAGLLAMLNGPAAFVDDEGPLFGRAEAGFVYGGDAARIQVPAQDDGATHERNLASFLEGAFHVPGEPRGPQPQAGGAPADGFASMFNGLFASLAGPHGGHAFGHVAGRLGDYATDGQLANLISDLLGQAGGNVGPPPLSEPEIAAIPRRSLTDKDLEELKSVSRDTCDVCKEDYESGEDCLFLDPCHHIFHNDCVKPWFRESPTCPSCRANLRTDPPPSDPALATHTAATSVEAEDVD